MMFAYGASHPVYFPHPVIYLSFRKGKSTSSYDVSVLFCFVFFFQRAELVFSHKSVSGEQPSIVVMYHNIIITVGLLSLNLAFRILDVHHCLGSELKMPGENKNFCIHLCELSKKSFIAVFCQVCSVPRVAR